MRVWVPRPDQEAVLAFLEPRDKAAVWAPTGAGKTAIASAWADWHLHDRFSLGRLLIVAPPIVARDSWAANSGQWAHVARVLQSSRLLGSADFDLTRGPDKALCFRDKRATKRHLQTLRERVHIVPWSYFPFLAEAYGVNWPYQGVIFDEASFLRDQGSTRSVAAWRCVHKRGMTHVLELTATSNANSDEAVYSQIELLHKGLLGRTLTEFRETYCIPDSKNWQTGQVYSWRIAPAMRAEFERRCATVAISVPDNLGIEVLPVEHWVDVEAGEQREAYDAIGEHMVWRDVVCGSAGVRHLKLRQIASGFVYIGDDDDRVVKTLSRAKQDKLQEVVASIPGQALVAYEFDAERALLGTTFGPKECRDIRERGALEDFKAGKLKLLSLHPKSAGHGIDGLQERAKDVLWMSVPEDAELWHQVNGRLKRPGQDAPTVMAHVLITRGTVEEDIWRDTLPGKDSNAGGLSRATRAVVA